MKAVRGFTLIEIIIIIAIIALLAIIVFATLNPLEQINRGRDTGLMQLAAQLYDSTNRMNANNVAPPWTEALSAIVLSNSTGQIVLENIVAHGELKNGFVESNSRSLSKIYLTTAEDYSKIHFCFTPISNAFRQHQLAKFNASGDEAQELCPEEGCYLCIGTEGDSTDNQQPNINLSEMTEEELCADFNPEYPYYPYTTNTTTMNSEYGCTNFSITDMGCNTGACPSGSRQLRKRYSGNGPGGNFTSCLLAGPEITEYYCVPEPYANCAEYPTPYSSGAGSFEWGCTNPRRPMRWIELDN